MNIPALALTIVLTWPGLATQLSPPEPPGTSARPTALATFNVNQALGTSAQVLLNAIRPGFNPIPVVVLNKARCVIFINSKGAADAWGITSCRLTPNDWSGPAFVSFHADDRAQASRHRELLVLVMSVRAAQSLTAGQLQLGSSAPGPVVGTRAANLTEPEITADAFTYTRVGMRLAPGAVRATIKPDLSMTRALYPRRADIPTVLTRRAPVPKRAAGFVTAVGSFFNTITPVGIIIHHSAILPTTHRVPTDERQIDAFHQKRGFAAACFGRVYHVAYHYFILPNGSVKAGRPENCQGAHAYGYNAHLGISLAGDFSSSDNARVQKGRTKPTPAQLKSLVALCRRLMRRYRISPNHILRHSDVAHTNCPGDRFPYDTVMKQLRAH